MTAPTNTLMRALRLPVGSPAQLKALATIDHPGIQPTGLTNARTLAADAVSTLRSTHSRRAYARYLEHFILSGERLTREGVQHFINRLVDSKCGPQTVNQALAALKLFSREAYHRQFLSDQELNSIEAIKSMPVSGSKTGNWLETSTVKLLLDAASQSAQPVRNCALVAILVGCGLRRTEVCSLQWSQWRQIGGRYVWADVLGKGSKYRTVPAPKWTVQFVEAWRKQCETP